MRPTVFWQHGRLVMLDQNRLPHEEAYVSFDNWRDVAAAIRDMTVRGAPAIGVAAAYGLALAARSLPPADPDAAFEEACDVLRATRPTAVNLFWAVRRMRDAYRRQRMSESAPDLLAEATAIDEEDANTCRLIGRHGAALLKDGDAVLTHCNAGALATAGYGTALGVVRAAVEQGKHIQVFADETRPRLQGMRLTAWELMRDGIDVTVIPDNVSGSLMRAGRVQAVVVGADRIAGNGDAANKIGTYNVAVLAQHHGIPFYVAAPWSTVDVSLPDGSGIPIEERDGAEVTCVGGTSLAPAGVKVLNPAFDVTPASMISAVITERGVSRPPYHFE